MILSKLVSLTAAVALAVSVLIVHHYCFVVNVRMVMHLYSLALYAVQLLLVMILTAKIAVIALLFAYNVKQDINYQMELAQKIFAI